VKIIELKINRHEKQGYLIHSIGEKHFLCKITGEYDDLESAKRALVEVLTGKK